jgi:beta-glucuronidase
MTFLKSVLVTWLMFFVLVSSVFAQKSVSPRLVNQKYLNKILLAAKKYNSKMNVSKPVSKPFCIDDPGTEQWIDYEQYGQFQNLGQSNYKYVIEDLEGLRKASGSGIFPNRQSIYKEKGYEDYLKSGKLEGNKWDFVNSPDYQANFYKWASESEEPGVKLYYTAYALEMAGNYKQAIKAYYACLVFFPKALVRAPQGTPWYVAPLCISKIKYLTRKHPELGIMIEDVSIIIENRFDNGRNSEKFRVNPGRLVPLNKDQFKRKYIDLAKVGIKKVIGTGNVKLLQYNNNHFTLTVDGKPYVVRAVSYSPNKVGLSPDFGNLNVSVDWSYANYNGNKKIDGPYDAWVDANRDNMRGDNEKSIGDFALMWEMGVNTLRIYNFRGINKQLLMDGYEQFGFMYMIGNFIGMYGVESGAEWFEGTDYTNKKHRENMFNSIKTMVETYKDEPYVLMWVLGNENNYGTVGIEGQFNGTSNKAQKQPIEYYKFVNECAKLIKSLDSRKRPVAICNGDEYFLDYCAKNALDIDIYGSNAYRGPYGFGSMWSDVMNQYGKPVVITEYGCPAYGKGWSEAAAEEGQAEYHKGCWNDIEDNLAGVESGVGNALGGVIFEWTDEWWKSGENPYGHDQNPQWHGPFLDGCGYEEWFGICSVGDGRDSPFKRQLRRSYFMYRDLWSKYKK